LNCQLHCTAWLIYTDFECIVDFNNFLYQSSFRCSSPSKLIGPRNVYNVSSATLTSYTSYSDGDSLDASLPNHLGLPVVKQKKSKTSLGTRAREKKILASIRNFLIVLALSIHSVFEGMAIGKDNSFLIFLRFDKFFLISGCVILKCALNADRLLVTVKIQQSPDRIIKKLVKRMKAYYVNRCPRLILASFRNFHFT
jgi:hypothetical protein